MTAIIIPFPAPTSQRPEPIEASQPYDFWYSLIEMLPPDQRRTTVEDALRCGVIDKLDAEIFMVSWPNVPGFWSEGG